MSEIAQAYAWIESTCLADSALTTAATGGVWQGLADIGTVAPFVSFTQQSNSDVLTLNAVRLWDNILMQIKAVGPTSGYATLITIADRIDTLFGSVRYVALSVGGVLSCYRESAYALDQEVNGQQWSYLGGLYRIALQGS